MRREDTGFATLRWIVTAIGLAFVLSRLLVSAQGHGGVIPGAWKPSWSGVKQTAVPQPD